MSKENTTQPGLEDEALSLFFPCDDEKINHLPDKAPFRLGHVGWYVHTKLNISSMCPDVQQEENAGSKQSVALLANKFLSGEKLPYKVEIKCEERVLESASMKSVLPLGAFAGPSRLSTKSINGQTLYFCNECPYKSNFKRSVNRHIESVHMGLRSFQCPFCEYKANYMSNIKRHVTSVHDGDRRFACPRCDYRTSDRGHLSSHIKAVHDKVKPFRCMECTYHASKRTDLNIHVKTVHNKEKPHQCPYCKYQASKNCNLKRHIKNIHEDPPSQKVKKRTRKNDGNSQITSWKQTSASKTFVNQELDKISSLESLSFENSKQELVSELNENQGTTKGIFDSKMDALKYLRMDSLIDSVQEKGIIETSKYGMIKKTFGSEPIVKRELETSLISNLSDIKGNFDANMPVKREIEISIVPKSE